MNIPKWVEIVLPIQSGAEPDCTESKHTCNAGHRCAKANLVERGGAQNYRVKRLSACGGCLGDYRR